MLLGNRLNAVTRLHAVAAAADSDQIPTWPAILIRTDRIHGDHDRNDNSDSDCKTKQAPWVSEQRTTPPLKQTDEKQRHRGKAEDVWHRARGNAAHEG